MIMNSLIKRAKQYMERVRDMREEREVPSDAFRFNHITNTINTAVSLYLQNPLLVTKEELEVALKEGRDYLDAIDKDPVFGREQLYEEGPYNSRLFSREEALRFGVTNPDDVKAFIDIYCRGTREE